MIIGFVQKIITEDAILLSIIYPVSFLAHANRTHRLHIVKLTLRALARPEPLPKVVSLIEFFEKPLIENFILLFNWEFFRVEFPLKVILDVEIGLYKSLCGVLAITILCEHGIE